MAFLLFILLGGGSHLCLPSCSLFWSVMSVRARKSGGRVGFQFSHTVNPTIPLPALRAGRMPGQSAIWRAFDLADKKKNIVGCLKCGKQAHRTAPQPPACGNTWTDVTSHFTPSIIPVPLYLLPGLRGHCNLI